MTPIVFKKSLPPTYPEFWEKTFFLGGAEKFRKLSLVLNNIVSDRKNQMGGHGPLPPPPGYAPVQKRIPNKTIAGFDAKSPCFHSVGANAYILT